MHPQQQLALALFAYAAQRGVAATRLESLTGLRTAALLDPAHGPLSSKQWHDLWAHAAHLTQDPLFGLHFGEATSLAALGAVGQIIQASRTVGEALTHGAALLPLLTDYLELELSPRGPVFSVHLRVRPAGQAAAPELRAHLRDFFLVFVLHELDGLVLERIQPRAVLFPAAAGNSAEYARVLRCPAIGEGGPGTYSLSFAARYWDLPILTVNYELQAALLQKVADIRPPDAGSAPLRDKVSSYLVANSYLGLPSLEALAANFHTSARSLQRRLQAEGVTYQDLTDEVRKSLALHYLGTKAYPLKEVSYMLGYNEFSAFSRAVKRWTGQSPVQYQALLN